ncbi:MAG: ParA family protein [Oscillospiraceae bacterium]|nr:ParA family protein [Oscillospiraceae bacterium]
MRNLVITGHYGSGKTTYSLNLALEEASAGKSVALVDMDIVNPYFRSGDHAKALENAGIRVIVPLTLGTTSDAPQISAEIMGVFDSPPDVTIFDAGGDDVGATALGRYSGILGENGYEMRYVINAFRPMTDTAQKCAEILAEIEQASRLKAASVVNNSNLGRETTATHILSSMAFAREVCRLTGLPLLEVVAAAEEAHDLREKIESLRVINYSVFSGQYSVFAKQV